LSEDNQKVRVSGANEISSLINYLITLLNIKADPSEQNYLNNQMLVVGELIITKFGELTIPEIKEAFRMYVAREFADIKPFRLLDAIAVGEVLNAFREYKRESLHVYNQKKIAMLPEQTEITESEKSEIRKQWKEDFMKRFENKERTDDAWLMYNELISDGLKVLDERKKQLYISESKRYLEELKSKTITQPSLQTKQAYKEAVEKLSKNDTNGYITNRCKTILVLEYLEKLETIKKLENEQ